LYLVLKNGGIAVFGEMEMFKSPPPPPPPLPNRKKISENSVPKRTVCETATRKGSMPDM